MTGRLLLGVGWALRAMPGRVSRLEEEDDETNGVEVEAREDDEEDKDKGVVIISFASAIYPPCPLTPFDDEEEVGRKFERATWTSDGTETDVDEDVLDPPEDEVEEEVFVYFSTMVWRVFTIALSCFLTVK